jgi:hypothetical protein
LAPPSSMGMASPSGKLRSTRYRGMVPPSGPAALVAACVLDARAKEADQS